MPRTATRFSRFAGLLLFGVALTAGCAQLLGLKEDAPPTPCVLNSDCATSEQCIFRVCSAACKLDEDCLPGSRCLDTNGSAACVSSHGAECGASTDGGDMACPDGSLCDATGTCRNDCTACHADQACAGGVCVGTDPNHDPGGASSGGADGSGTSGGGGGGVGGSGATGGRVGTGGSNGKAGSGATEAGAAGVSAGGDAGAPGTVTVTCGDTAVGDSAPCNELPDGTAINFPGGKPQGPCVAGTKLCKSDGTFASCVGAVAPGQTDCQSASDKNCDGTADNTQCGVCTVGATQYCYDGASGTMGVGPCKQGTQVCQLDASGKQSVWGTCAGEITPALSDTCDSGNDATCNKVPNEGCACINNQTGSCGAKLQALGNCAAGATKCTAGNWGACSIVAKGNDTCDSGDDSTCDGAANTGCGCINGHTLTCGSSGTGCTLGAETCQAGAYGGCAGNVCSDFPGVTPTGKCTASGPATDDADVVCKIAGICSAGYHVTDCVMHASATNGQCTFNGADSADPTAADVDSYKPTGASSSACTFTSCSCRLNGF